MEQIIQNIKDRFALRYILSEVGWPAHPTVIMRLQARGYLDSSEQLTPKGSALLQSE